MVTTPNGLTYSTAPITSTTPGEVIHNLDLYVTGNQPAISITSDNVTIKNVRIHVAGGDGIDVYGNSATISGVEVDGPTPNGLSGGNGNDGIYSYDVTGLKVDHLTVRDVGAGVNAVESPGTVLSYIEGHDMQGPFPTGQLVQLNRSNGSSLTNFYSQNNAQTSHPEDVVSVVSENVTIANGVIDGDNSPSGVGVMFEGDAGGGQVSNVDAVHMGDGAFSSYSDNVSFDHVRSFDNIAADQGRGTPLSNGNIFAAEASNISFTNATYTRPANPNNILDGAPVAAQITQDPSATVQSHITNVFSWSNPTTVTTPVAAVPVVAPVVAAPVAAVLPVTSASGGDTLSLSVSQDAYNGNARFAVTVDGKEVAGPQTVTALHNQGQAQTFTLTGNFGKGAHQVGVNFLNDAYAGSSATDRNLYVNALTLDGKTTALGAQQFHQGIATYAVSSGTAGLGSALSVGAGATLILDAKAGANTNVTFAAPTGSLQLTDAASFHGSVTGFSHGDSIDLRSILHGSGSTPSLSFSGNDASQMLTVSDGTHAATLNLNGNYTQSSFHLGNDHAGGSLLTMA